MINDLFVVFICILFSAFFSGTEIAFVSSNKLSIAVEKNQGNILARIIDFFYRHSNQFITTLLIGNNIALVVFGIYMGNILMRIIHGMFPILEEYYYIGLFLQTLLSTIIIIISAEFIPKTIGSIMPNKTLKTFAIPSFIIYWLLWLYSFVTLMITQFIFWIFKIEKEQPEVFSKLDLENYVSEEIEKLGDDDDVDSEIQIFKNALEFDEIRARECMIPRNEIHAFEVDDTIDSLKEDFVKTGFSKILIYKDDIDNLIGYVHSHELFNRPKKIREVIRPIEFVSESMLIKDVMNILIKKRKSIAVVTDEYGGTAGILTTEDIVEELFGEIEDEHDTIDLLEEQVSDYEFIFSARLEVDYINDKYKMSIPEEDSYETLGGWIMSETENVPEPGEIIYIEPYRITIEKATDSKIELISLVLTDKE